MNKDFMERLIQIFPLTADWFIEMYDLISSYNPHRIDEEISVLVHSPEFDDIDTLPSRISRMFVDVMYSQLLELSILPRVKELRPLYQIMRGLRLVEDSLDSAAILHLIDGQQEGVSPEDTLASLIYGVDGGDWMEIYSSLRTVTPTLIQRIYSLHDDIVQSQLNEALENVIESRMDNVRKFFKCFDNTILGSYINKNIIPIPCDEHKLLTYMTNLIYAMDVFDEDIDKRIATELVAMAMIMPIADKHITRQARIFADKLFNDPTRTIALNNKIDMVMKQYEAFSNEKQ